LALLSLASCTLNAPRIGNVNVTGDLIAGAEQEIAVSCTVLGADTATIVSVTASLGAIGGPDNASLTRADTDNWQWSGTVTLPEAGDVKLVLNAKDSLGRQGSLTITVQVLDPGSFPPNNSVNSSISAGNQCTLILKSNGTVVAVTRNDYGELNIPTGLSNVTGISAGNGHCAAVKNDGTVVCWGYNGQGQCTIPDFSSFVTSPIAISGGWSHSVALCANNTVVAWGYTIIGKL